MTDVATPRGRYADLPWVRNSLFDTGFIFGLLALSMVTGLTILIEPRLFYPILVIDLWLLGYHHVISTFTRLCFDKESFAENKFLVVGLTPIVAAATILVAWTLGLWVIVTIYFYWQWWHYARQSWGVSRVFRAKDREGKYESGWVDQAIFFSVPVFGILSRSAEDHGRFIGLELWSIPISPEMADIAGYLAFGLFVYWTVLRIRAAAEGRLAVVHTMYMLSHFAIFYLAYCLMADITFGWLLINIWHNAQYILFVWMYNSKRFADGIDPKAKFLSYISQPGRLWLYMLTCIAITGVMYWGVLRAIDWLFFSGLAATIVLYQIANFHHYIVDSVIWKIRKPTMRKTLDLGSEY